MSLHYILNVKVLSYVWKDVDPSLAKSILFGKILLHLGFCFMMLHIA